MKFSLERKIFIEFMLVIFVLAILGIFSFQNNKRFVDASNLAPHKNEELHHTEKSIIITDEMKIGFRGFLISRILLYPLELQSNRD